MQTTVDEHTSLCFSDDSLTRVPTFKISLSRHFSVLSAKMFTARSFGLRRRWVCGLASFLGAVCQHVYSTVFGLRQRWVCGCAAKYLDLTEGRIRQVKRMASEAHSLDATLGGNPHDGEGRQTLVESLADTAEEPEPDDGFESR